MPPPAKATAQPATQPADDKAQRLEIATAIGPHAEELRELRELRERVKEYEEKDRKRAKLIQTLAAQILTPPADNDKGNKRAQDIRQTLTGLVDLFAPSDE